jgi:AcrR family transcriptional regulator
LSKKKDAIIQTAKILFANKGYAQTSMAELSQLTGAAEGTIFYHFKNKAQIFVSILTSIKDQLVEEIDKALARQEFQSGCDMLQWVFSFYLELAGRMKDELLILHRHYPYEMAQENPVCRELLETTYNRFWDLFEQALVMGQSDGSIHVNSPRKTAMILYAMVDGIARLDTYRIYDAGALYNELMNICRLHCVNGTENR